MFNKLKFFSSFILLFFCCRSYAQEKVNVDMYVYHLQPPYALNTATKTGMFFDFADYINSKTERYHFTIVYVPRKRIGSMLKDGKLNGVLLGVNPLWFNDINETKFLWTGSFSEDQDEVVSSVDNSIEYTGADSLSGKVMAGVRGFYYLVSVKKLTKVVLFVMIRLERMKCCK
ncbi:hypothetical protein L3081_16275 [Colwellia sp. MSW7]|uniref:Solute-binding protein family 3/N-terminal domain-containing protein n=1 Tax=Colwellia maritima TaxID=2912588 RepID=A0ABS9X361_9GAMM|nr:hypothetical protein [Colwellia maritima]MCI2284659.1 hypothetical protein [Colwellia maritima]